MIQFSCVGITGARGTLGRLLQRQLIEAGTSVSTFDGDICSSNDIRQWLSEISLDAIFHLAAMVPIQLVNARPARAFAVNVGGTAQLIDALATQDNAPWLFYASSSHVYKPQNKPISELCAIAPTNTYGLTKYMGEQVIEASADHARIRWCIGRIFSFYHPSQTGSFLYPTIRARLAEEDLSLSFRLIGADDVRDISRAEDIVTVMIRMMQSQLRGIFNIGSGTGTRIADFVQSLALRDLRIVNASDGPRSILVADIAKLQSVLH